MGEKVPINVHVLGARDFKKMYNATFNIVLSCWLEYIVLSNMKAPLHTMCDMVRNVQ